MKEKRVYLLPLLMVLLVSLPALSVKVSYHDENVEKRSTEIFQNSTFGAPMDGVFSGGRYAAPFETSFMVPFPEHGSGRGSVMLLDREGVSLTNISLDEDELDLSGCPPLTGYLDDDHLEDILLKGANGSWYLFRGRSPDRLDTSTVLSSDDMVAGGPTGPAVLMDTDGDGTDEMVHLSDNGSSLMVSKDIIDAPSMIDEVELPFNCTRVLSADDTDGDLVPDIVVYGERNSSSALLIYSGIPLKLSNMISLPEKAVSISTGDMNGDWMDEIAVHLPDLGSSGGIFVVQDGSKTLPVEAEDVSWKILGGAGMGLLTDVNLRLLDLDGDGASDLVIGDPQKGAGKGRISIFYGGPDRDYSTDTSYMFPDADLVGNDTSHRLGSGFYISEYDMSSTVPRVYLGKNSSLVEWELPGWREPIVQSSRFLESGQGMRIERAQMGQRIGIWIAVSQGSPTRVDSMRVWLRAVNETRFCPYEPLLLTETGPGTGVLYGEMIMGEHGSPSRSLCAFQNATVGIFANSETLSAKLHIRGRIGLDDPPYFEGSPQVQWTAVEGSPFEKKVEAYDPDGDPISWSHSALPAWLGHENGTFRGTPGNDDVGNHTFNSTISSTSHSVSLTFHLEVLNFPPSIVEVSVAPMAWEGQVYVSKFHLREDGEKWNVSVKVQRNAVDADRKYQWLQVARNGTVTGVPENIHVGNWTAVLELDDGNPPSGSVVYNWNISVVNKVPELIAPGLVTLKEYEPALIDLDSDQEGENGTVYSIISSNLNDLWLDPLTGKMTFTPIIGVQETGITVRVTDMWGEYSEGRIEVHIENSLPYLTSPLPDVLVAGEVYEMDIDSNEEGNDLDYLLHPAPPVFSDHDTKIFTSEGRMDLFPWNRDEGEHRYTLVLRDNLGAYRNYSWNFTVLPNSSYVDPDVELDVEVVGSRLILSVNISAGGKIIRDPVVRIYKKDPEPDDIRKTIDPSSDEPVEFDISGFNGTILVNASFDVETTPGDLRHVYKEIPVRIPEPEEVSRVGSGIWIIILLIVLIFLIAGAGLAMIEKTSYAFQTLLFNNGVPRDEVVLSAVQDDPGVRLRDLGDTISISRKDLVTTLVKLEDEGHIRSVPDGFFIRFLPTVGSFMEGPLAMNRSQIRIARTLMDRKKLTRMELMEETGFSKRKLDRETSLMRLKDALSERKGPRGKEYYMSSRQKKKVREWVERKD
ncbi:MAG: hypothetical protein R6V01_02880 [Thermoplasmatota archaeon]